MEPDKIAETTITQVVAEVAQALKNAAVEYGPEAADLALLAFRVDAIKTLTEIPVILGICVALWKGWRWFWVKSEEWDDGDRFLTRCIAFIAGAVAFVSFGVEAIDRIIDIPVWVAAFGSPELLIATRALEAAGLM
jgi:hypothetical protein